MNTINERFKEIRKSLKKTQEEFGNILGITREGVASIEANRRNVTDKHIKFLCIESIDGKYVNEEWLRDGIGNMFVSLSRNQTITDFAADLIKEEATFKKRLIEALAKLDEKDWEDLERLAAKLTKKD